MRKIINKRIFGNEIKYLKEVIKTEFSTSSGAKMMNLFEKKFAKTLYMQKNEARNKI